MYAHRRCVPDGAELVTEKVVHGYCGVCGVRGTIYYVKGSVDSYETKRQGVRYTVVAGTNTTDPEPLEYDDLRVDTEEVLGAILEEIVNDETAEILSAEEVEEEEQEIEAGGEAAISEGLGSEPALEAVEAEPDSSAPSIEMPVEAKTMDVDNAILSGEGILLVEEKKFVKTPLEAETEVIARQEENPAEMAPAEAVEPTEDEAVAELPEPEAEAVSEPSEAEIAAAQKKADIARLEAELEALRN